MLVSLNPLSIYSSLPPTSIHRISAPSSSLTLSLSPLLVGTQQFVRNLRHLHVLHSSRNIAFFLIKDLLNDG
jgi:hypothetical protein